MDEIIFNGYVEIKAPPPPPPKPKPEAPPVNPYAPIEFREGTLDQALRRLTPGSMIYRVLKDIQRR